MDTFTKKRMGMLTYFLTNWLRDVHIFIFYFYRLSATQQKHAMAITYFEKTLDLMETKFGKDSPELIPVYQGMGLVSLETWTCQINQLAKSSSLKC